MSSPFFDFKRFRIYHDRCAMKVGTDGVLLGAWSTTDNARRILDVGAGCGLVALMAAQRAAEATVMAIEIDPEAAAQAAENVRQSPFARRVSVVCADFRTFKEQGFDAVFSNPPFFEETLLPPGDARSMARHAHDSALTFEQLTQGVARCLNPQGHFSVILPTAATDRFDALCEQSGLHLARRTLVITAPGKQPKRTLSEYVKGAKNPTPHVSELLLTAGGSRSEAYRQLAADFYL